MLSFLLVSQPTWAARTPIHDAADSPNYGRKFGGMIGRGLLNVATSFVDILVNVVNDTKNGPPLVGTLTGVAKGVGCGTLRIASGAVDLVGFWVPGFNGFPVSDSYENCLAPRSAALMEELPPGYSTPSQPAWDMPAESVPSRATPEEPESMPTPQAAPAPRKTWKK
jgi:putative exosortase-associated protein (TIGR04073 family)